MTEKRMRGRPLGSDIDDRRFLTEVADFLENNPRMKATAAIRQVIKTREGQWVAASAEAMKRRLQVKWKAQRAVLQAQAKQRAEERVRPVTLADIIDVSVRVRDAWLSWQTPENLAGLQRFADRAAIMIKDVTAALSHIQPVTIHPDTAKRITEASRQIAHFQRVAGPIERFQKEMVGRQDSLKLLAEAQKQLEYAGKIHIPKL